MRDHALRVDEEKFRNVIQILGNGMEKIRQETNLDSLRGIEGECAAVYFGVFDDMILNQKDVFYFNGRNKRPPLDYVNSMLSFGYTLLVNDCARVCICKSSYADIVAPLVGAWIEIPVYEISIVAFSVAPLAGV